MEPTSLPSVSPPSGEGGDDRYGELREKAVRQKRNTYLAAAFVAVSLLVLLRGACRPTDKPGCVRTLTDHTGRAAEVLGRHLAIACPDAKILLITDPPESGDYRKELVAAARKGLTRGLAGKGRIEAVAAPQFSGRYLPAPPLNSPVRDNPKIKWLPSTEEWFVTDALVQTLLAHPDCNLAVSMVGLPIDDKLPVLPPTSDGSPAKLAVLLGDLGGPERLSTFFGKNTLVGAILWHPRDKSWVDISGLAGIPIAESPPSCVLIKPATVEKIIGSRE